MNRLLLAGLAGALLAGTALTPVTAAADSFRRIATFPVYENRPEGADAAETTASEIITASEDGQTLIYSDSPGGRIGFIDIADPAAPQPAGTLDMGGEPTSVTVKGGFVFAGVNTSESRANPSGHVAVVDLATRAVVATCDVGGQPDSVAASADGRYLAVVVENERDEDVDDGVIPQMPAGTLAILDLGADGQPANCDAARFVDLTGIADIVPEDPEPEFVDINADNVAVVSLQENNHLALIDLATGTVTAHFPAGAVDLAGIDTTEDGLIAGTGSLSQVPREPDAVGWLDATRFVTANEGDYEGGSRSFTIFNTDGSVDYEAGALIEHIAMTAGHYPEGRADAKGTEPEGAEVASFGGQTLIFIGSERANIVSVFADRGAGQAPEYLQVLPTGIGPEGLLAIPQRNLFVVAAEEDSAEDAVRSTVTIYGYGPGEPNYPTIESTDSGDGTPIGWGALSGLSPVDGEADRLYAVPDNIYARTRIFTIDVSGEPARIVGQLELTRDGETVDYDAEGIVARPDGGFWLASEGDPAVEGDFQQNLLIAVAADGTVEQEVPLPEALAAEATRYGFEGVTLTDGGDTVWVAIQRSWNDDAENQVKLGAYTPATGEWRFVAYPLDAPTSPAGGWVGLSEITALDDDTLLVLERDNQRGLDAAEKVIYRVDLAGVEPVPYGETLPVVSKTLAFDLLPALRAPAGWTPDKPEGFTVTADGRLFLVTDNDGVDAASGESQFLRLGTTADLQ